MSEKKSIYKPRPVSGFPEWLPEVRLVEQQWLDHIRKVFESYGYCSIETPAVEELNVIQAKGGDGGADVDKEVYVIERLHKEDGDKEARLALHFDQTVPLARYVAQHFNELVFPFKRYQMQKVWRGERPQSGRFREFYQCDIDVINPENLPLHFDAEMPAIIWEILAALPGMENEKIQLRISNRKILLGFLGDWGARDIPAVLRILDKAEKVGEGQTFSDLAKACSHSPGGEDVTAANILMGLAGIKASTSQDLKNKIQELKTGPGGQATYTEGLEELCSVLDQLSHLPKGAVVADLSIIRGLDYYTGTVYETVFVDDPDYGSICSGGRYDDLASNYINKKLPGVGISIGFSRLFARLKEQNKLPVGPVAATDVLVTLIDENERALSAKKAKELRDAGFNVEMYHKANNPKKQFEYAEKKGIPFVFVPKQDAPGAWEVKNMKERKQLSEQDWIKEMEKCCA
ncbi:MAG: histidine--tRNA ligase [Alphaproteobacteria bacterium]